MSVLADTSIWVEYLRRGQAGQARHLDDLLQSGEVVLCGPVVAEILAGAAQPDRDHLWLSLQALPWVRLDQSGWRQVGQAAGALRDRGFTVPLTDIQIAVGAVLATAPLWTHDGDFQRVTMVLPDLKLYAPPP